jgi:DNA-binding NarL/FixJ family response regulator
VLDGFRAGLPGYVIKSRAAGDLTLVSAIGEVLKSAIYVGVGISRALIEAPMSKADVPLDPLILREREVLQLVAEGNTTRELAMALGITSKTAEKHRSRVMRQLDIAETARIPYAIRRGLVYAKVSRPNRPRASVSPIKAMRGRVFGTSRCESANPNQFVRTVNVAQSR